MRLCGGLASRGRPLVARVRLPDVRGARDEPSVGVVPRELEVVDLLRVEDSGVLARRVRLRGVEVLGRVLGALEGRAARVATDELGAEPFGAHTLVGRGAGDEPTEAGDVLTEATEHEVRPVGRPRRARSGDRPGIGVGAVLVTRGGRGDLGRLAEHELTRPQQVLTGEPLVLVVGVLAAGHAPDAGPRHAVLEPEVLVAG